MHNRLVLLPGWGLGVAPLQPLAAALQVLDTHLQVQIEPLPQIGSSSLPEWLDQLDASLPQDCWLGGWSLGGMLSSALAARRGERCRGLVTLASNPCFVVRANWPEAMAVATFRAFLDGCRTDPAITLKRFSLLCAQGAAAPRNLGRLLAANAPPAELEPLLCGLELLQCADVRLSLKQFSGPQLHLLAAGDALVPSTLSAVLRDLREDIVVIVREAGSHAFVREDPEQLAAMVLTFFKETQR